MDVGERKVAVGSKLAADAAVGVRSTIACRSNVQCQHNHSSCERHHTEQRVYEVGYGDIPIDQLEARITKRWIQTFMERFGIVGRRQCGKLMTAERKQRQMEQKVAYHLGMLCRGFGDGSLEEDLVENVDETHFVINMDNDRTLSFIGAVQVKYADVASGNDAITMVARVTVVQNASIQLPFPIFLNKMRNCPINGSVRHYAWCLIPSRAESLGGQNCIR